MACMIVSQRDGARHVAQAGSSSVSRDSRCLARRRRDRSRRPHPAFRIPVLLLIFLLSRCRICRHRIRNTPLFLSRLKLDTRISLSLSLSSHTPPPFTQPPLLRDNGRRAPLHRHRYTTTAPRATGDRARPAQAKRAIRRAQHPCRLQPREAIRPFGSCPVGTGRGDAARGQGRSRSRRRARGFGAGADVGCVIY